MVKTFNIGIIGDFDPNKISHTTTEQALNDTAQYLKMSINIEWLPTEELNKNQIPLKKFQAFWCAPGGLYKSLDGALYAIQYARENNIPYIGTCGGFQHTIIEFARNVLGIKEAQHAEYKPDSNELVITPLSCSIAGQTTEVFIKEDTKAQSFYNCTKNAEQFRCNFGINPSYQTQFEENGLVISGVDANDETRIIEIPENDCFIATLFVPQMNSTVEKPHPLVLNFLRMTSKKN